MTFYKTPEIAREKSLVELTTVCVSCGDPLTGATVVYELYGTDTIGHTFHRQCAFEMAQRMICDAWPNRHASDVS